MSKFVSAFLAAAGSLLVALVLAGTMGTSAATPSDEVADPAPTTTTTPAQDGHPWYG